MKSYFKTLTLILGNSDNDLLFPEKKDQNIIINVPIKHINL